MSKLAYTAEKSAWAAVIVALGFIGSLLGQWWNDRDVTPPAPVPVVIDEARSYVTRNGVTLADADAKAIIAAVKIGDGSYSLVSYPIGEKPVTKAVLIGDVKPDVVPVPPKPIDPVTPVKPLPDGFAGEVAKQAAGKPKADCVKLADNFQSVASIIAAGGITKIDDAHAEIVKLNKALNLDKAVWAAFSEWIGKEFTKNAQDLSAARSMMRDAAIGLNYAGGK